MKTQVRLKLNKKDAAILLSALNEIKIDTIENFLNLIIFYYVKDNNTNFYAKFKKVENNNKNIKFLFSVPQAAAIIEYIKNFKNYPFPMIVFELHQQVINYISFDSFNQTKIESQDLKMLNI